MEAPLVAKREPIAVDVEKGEKYFWCSCGKSQNQPFCDGSHQGSSFVPVKYIPDEAKTVYFCCCKNSKASPLCDGTHKSLSDD